MTTPPHPTSVPFDSSALTLPVDQRAAKEHTARLRAAGAVSGNASTAVTIIATLAVGVAFLTIGMVFLGIVIAAVTGMDSQQGGATMMVVALIPLAFVLLIPAAFVWIFVTTRRRTAARRYRLWRFAEANGMSYVPEITQPALPGMIFSLGNGRVASDAVRGQQPRFVEFANYRYVTGSGKNQTTHKWGYVAVHLDVPLPHIVLDAVGNNGLLNSNLPMSFRREQRLGLEGDFDRHFSLYCPAGYEQDALYLFTPDIMARFVDHAAELDVEIVDDWLFLYAKRDFSTLDPATWAWLFSVVGALLTKLDQWARWRDERLRREQGSDAASALPFTAPPAALTPPGVAPEGRRLRKRVAWWVLIPFALASAWIVAQIVGAVFSVRDPW